MLTSLEGEEATGKTTFAYTAPLKIVGFSFDMGIERALFGAKHQELFSGVKIKMVPYADKPVAAWADSDITVYELPLPIQLEPIKVEGAVALWQYFTTLAVQAMRDASVRTLVVDTMTLARRVKADAYLEMLQNRPRKQDEHMREKLLQIEWGNPNDAIREFYTATGGSRKNLVAVHHLTDERKNTVDAKTGLIKEGVPTGRRILEGLSGTHRFVDVALLMEQEKGSIKATFKKCGYNLAYTNTSMSNPTWDSVVNRIEMSLGGRMKFDRRNNSDA